MSSDYERGYSDGHERRGEHWQEMEELFQRNNDPVPVQLSYWDGYCTGKMHSVKSVEFVEYWLGFYRGCYHAITGAPHKKARRSGGQGQGS